LTVFLQNGHSDFNSHANSSGVLTVSEHSHSTGTETASPAESGTALATPEFDRRELNSFGQDDGHAVTVIGKMLVGFFFYSFLVMAGVALWTMSRGGQVDSHAAQAEHAEDTEE
jgi:hypothetical protein